MTSLATSRLGSDAPGHSPAFTVGGGTEVQVATVRSYAPLVVGLAVEDALQDPGAFSRRLGADNLRAHRGPGKMPTEEEK
jgi:hypothetical protein